MRQQRPARGDVIAGVSVALVLVPQSLAYAELAGMPPGTGLLVAAVAGLAAAPFASSPFLQTGPVAITALLVFGSLAPLADPASGSYLLLAAWLAVLVGVVRLVIGLLRAGDLAYLMSEPVVAGFTAAAAVVIIATQIPDLLGVEGVGAGPLPDAIAVLVRPDRWSWPTVAMGGAVLVTLVVARRFTRRFPTVLVVLIAAVVASRLLGFEGAVVGDVPGVLPAPPGMPGAADLVALVVPALVIAVIGFGDVAAISRTYATATRTRWDADREFVAQGVANVASGVVGGFAVGGSFSRTAIAVESGATTRWAGAIASAMVLAALPLAGLVADLPVAALGAVIIVSVLGLADPRPVFVLRRYSRQQFVIAASTAVLTLVLAPQIQWALVIGVGLSVAAHLRRELRIDVASGEQQGQVHLRPTGVLYFASAHRLVDQMRTIITERDVDHFVVHLDRLGRVDVTGALAIREFVTEARELDVTLEFVDATPASHAILSRVLGDAREATGVDTVD